MSLFTENERRQLRQMFAASGVAADRIDEIVDLACHAADEAADAFTRIVQRASSTGQLAMAIEIGAQLTASHFQGIAQSLHQLGQKMGLPIYCADIVREAGGNAHG